MGGPKTFQPSSKNSRKINSAFPSGKYGWPGAPGQFHQNAPTSQSSIKIQ